MRSSSTIILYFFQEMQCSCNMIALKGGVYNFFSLPLGQLIAIIFAGALVVVVLAGGGLFITFVMAYKSRKVTTRSSPL